MSFQIRASKLDQFLSCHGSLLLQPMVTPIERDDGDLGTMLHYLIAARAIRELGAIAPEGGLPDPKVTPGYVLPPNHLWVVDFAIRHIMETVPPDWTLMVEVPFEHEVPRWTNTGHADIVALSPDVTEARGIDWKNVRIPVDPADENWQVADYAALMKLSWPTLRRVDFDIVQPFVTEEDGVERVSTVCIEGDRLDALADTINARVCAGLDNIRELDSGLKACKYCDAALQCPATKALMKLHLTDEMLAQVKAEPSDADLGDWVVGMRTLKRPTEDAEELLHKRLDVQPVVVAGDGTQITRKVTKGSWSYPSPERFFQKVVGYFTGRDCPTEWLRLAKVFKPSMTALGDEIAEFKGIPKTSKAGMSAASELEQEFKTLAVQGERKTLQFL